MHDTNATEAGHRLAALGISEPAADAYFHLLRSADHSCPASLLAELQQAKLADEVDGEIVVYSAVRQLRERAEKRLAEAEAAFASAIELQRAAQDTSCSVTVFGAPEQVRNAHSHIVSSAQQTLRAFDCGPHLEDVPTLAEGQPESLAADVKHHVVYDMTVLQEPARRQVMLDAVALGEQARVVRSLPFRVLIADESQSLVIRRNRGSPGLTGVLVDDAIIVSLLGDLFETVWKSAAPLTFLASDDGSELDDEVYQLLILLGMGLTDDSIAQQLGVSVRTVTRRINGLAQLLGVRSRFQLGAAAQRSGWLS